ncbi:metal ABC transporter permease [Diplocloster modestus]|uniref:Metal ABC transporter permease n=1 Tax=Diplocloster modestus TaxID=2850322 RepID=A0ABS6KDE9_9FIRM|nr:metal ABC transporter permease [Diplocloster modestus]MBU9728538.1 metal ABC transporter permease [Diplocloster modestus]
MIYELLESVLPFSWVQYDFMKQAFLAILLITPLFGILGTMIVNHKMAFFSDALGHSALTGVAVGVLFGIPDTNLAMLIFAVLFALALNQIKSRNLMATDTIISVFSSFSIAIGLVILAQGGNFSKYSSLLVGDILSITPREILYLVLLLIGTLIFWIFCSNQLNSISINRSLAASRGIRVKLIENLFAVCIAVIVMLSIKWVGILIINALLILPAASARNISENMREYHFFSILFSLFSGIVGLIISYYVNTATGPTIVIIASVIFFATYFYSRHGK